MGRRWAAAMAEVAATGGSSLSGRVAVVVVVMVTGHLVVDQPGRPRHCRRSHRVQKLQTPSTTPPRRR
jgi:hypothetical protein